MSMSRRAKVTKVRPEDVGNTYIARGDFIIPCMEFMGPVHEEDVGKNIYWNNGEYEIEGTHEKQN